MPGWSSLTVRDDQFSLRKTKQTKNQKRQTTLHDTHCLAAGKLNFFLDAQHSDIMAFLAHFLTLLQKDQKLSKKFPLINKCTGSSDEFMVRALNNGLHSLESSLPVAFVAGGIVSAHEIKFWRRSRQASGKAAREDKGEREFLAALPLAFGGSTPKTLFRKRHTATYAGQHARDL